MLLCDDCGVRKTTFGASRKIGTTKDSSRIRTAPKKKAPQTSTPADTVDIGKSIRRTTNNLVTPWLGGDAATQGVIEQLKSAQSSIQVEMYRIGNQNILDALKEKAQSGTVKVQVLLDPTPGYDAGDTKDQNRIRAELKAAGVEVINYPIDKKGKIDHVKLLIVDGKRGVIGGLNWDRHSHANLDMNVLVQGEAVQDMSDRFAHDWKFAGGGETAKAAPVSPNDAKGDAEIRVVTTEEDSEAIRAVLMENINKAQKSIRMVAFALADKQVIDGLIAAKKDRKVDVKILLDPNKPVSWVNEKSKKQLEAAGIEVRYLAIDIEKEEKCHAKAAFFDDDTTVMGSANFTHQGLTVNHEADIEMKSKTVVPQMTKFFDELWEKRSVQKLPNLPDMEERADEEPYGESVAHRLFGWYNDTYHPEVTRNWTGHRKKDILAAMEQYGKTGGRPADNAPEEEHIGAMAAFLTKRQVWDINPGPGSGEKVYKVRMDLAKQAEQTVPQRVEEYKQKMLDMVKDADLKALLKDILAHAPEGFYKSPSSSTGKYHPADETRFVDVKPRLDAPSDEEISKYPGGGLVLHSLRNMVLAASLCDYYGIEGKARDEVIMGESLHDICKFVSVDDLKNWKPGQPVPWGKYTTKDHAHAGAEFVKALDPSGGKASDNVRRYIDMHMGAWNFPQPTPPKDNAERIISLADYLASTSDYYVKV